MAHEAGKGDMYRSVDQKKFDENFERIFGVKEKKVDFEYELDKSTGEVVKKYVTK
jgi:hypothetical protein